MKNSIILISLLCCLSNQIDAQNIVINEILSNNTSGIKDEDNTYQDWIELYNSGTTTENLLGFGLTDDSSVLLKWTFPNISLGPGQYLLIWASNKNRTATGNPLHTNFKISATGEVITLSNPAGIALNSAPAIALPANISFGRLPNGTGDFVFFNNVTPNAENSTVGYSEVLPPVTFSQNGGFFTSPITLNLGTTPGATILYTLDGSEPDENNLGGTTYNYKNQYPELPGQATGPLLNDKSFITLQYSAPLNIVDRSPQPNKIASISSTFHFDPDYIPAAPIFKSTVVRAKAIKPGALPSPITTKSYFITPLGNNRFTLPVISLSINEKKLYDYNNGIYVAGVDFDIWRVAHPSLVHDGIENIANFYRRGMQNETIGNFNYFVNGIEVINQNVGFRIHGASSREWQNKSFSIYAREAYGNSSINYNFFPNQSTTEFETLILRNSGSDFFETLFRDALNHELIKYLPIVIQRYQPTITFLNGEYWGILNLRDKTDDNYFKRVFNIPTNEIDILHSNATIDSGDSVDYLSMINYITNNSLADDSHYQYIKTRLDPENFADYFISNIFFQNVDWPGTNIYFWRKRTPSYIPNAPYGHDGRWRWLAHDMDATFATSTNNVGLNSLAAATAINGPSWPNPEWSTFLLRNMLLNNTFRIDFINRFADLLNTSFLSTRIVTTINQMKSVIEPEMPEQVARWKAPEFLSDWNYYLNKEISFANQRPALQRDHIRSQFGISNNIDASLDVSSSLAGYIKINTIDIREGTPGINANPYPWTGIYFADIPVKLRAIAYPGYTFSHWSGASTSTNPEITITSAINFSLTAIFTPETSASSHPIYYWMMNSSIENNVPLQTLSTTYRAGNTDGLIHYQSCLLGYPFTSSSPNWRKASLERRNSPTDINYIPEANLNIPFISSDMKGIQIKEPLQNNSLENTLIFNFSTSGYKDIKFSFAAVNELTNANNIVLDYALNDGPPDWTAIGLINNSFTLDSQYQMYNEDFSSITTVNNNANFKMRLRFTGSNMTADNGNKITFNNIAVHGTQIILNSASFSPVPFLVYPNPFIDTINILGINQSVLYELSTIDGKKIEKGTLKNASLNLNNLPAGMYLLRLSDGEKVQNMKIIKRE